jgi:hypothetical protein
MSIELSREFWAFPPRRGEEAAGRPIGPQFSEPALRAMLVHMDAGGSPPDTGVNSYSREKFEKGAGR